MILFSGISAPLPFLDYRTEEVRKNVVEQMARKNERMQSMYKIQIRKLEGKGWEREEQG
jgi:hypothetical protein